MRRRGAALIVVLGLLTVLAALATAFATGAIVDRSTSRNFLDAARARVLARSGVDTALGRLRGLVDTGAVFEGRPWAPCGHEADGRCAGPTAVVDGRVLGCSEPLGGTYATNGDLATFRIADAQAKIHVNDGVEGGPDHAVSRNLRRILDLLGAQPAVRVPGLGERLIGRRPKGGYVHPADLRAALDHDREAYDRVRPFLTVRAWRDPDVAHPVPFSEETAALPYARPSGTYRWGHQRNADGRPARRPLLVDEPVYGRDSLNPRWIEVVARAPVSVNAAAREVLVALITDLEGVFLVERRRPLDGGGPSPCGSPGGAYGWLALRHTDDPAGREGDEIGWLRRTRPFVGPGGRSRDGIPAEKVADEILACRRRERSPHVPGRDYAAVPYGGPFRTWPQFHAFCDGLVEGGLLVETRRELFRDVDAQGRPAATSDVQLRIASQAIADVLKANFDPNLHLNEINPDRALFLHVDKTDLIVHSTEFCLSPMGVFEIESVGRVLRPQGADDALRAKQNRVTAEATATAVVRLYDAVRHSTQAQFAAGECGPRKSDPETNNNAAVETGPEPDNGPAPSENGAEGWIRLSTIGSTFAERGERKPAGELRTTLSDPAFHPGAATSAPGGSHLGAKIHAHFQLDHAAHHHAGRNGSTSPAFWDGFRLPQGAWQPLFGRRAGLGRNWEDEGEAHGGPYGPVDAARPGGKDHRLARSFRGAPPPDAGGAPSDLRLDGAYAERGSALGYWLDESESFNFNEGVVAFWMKPAFFPEATGKRRTILSAGRFHQAARELMNPSPFGLFLVPAHAGTAGPPAYAAGLASFPPLSLAFGLGFSSRTGYNWETTQGPAAGHAAVFTPTLNPDGPLRAHEWMHVAVAWKLPRRKPFPPDAVQILVNGRRLAGTEEMAHRFEAEGAPFENTPRWTTHSLQVEADGLRWAKNALRIGGELSKLFDLPGDAGLFPGNYAADATIDEVYVWLDRGPFVTGGLWGAREHWTRGRYYVPDDRDPADARFTSARIDLTPPPGRRLPPASAVAGPEGGAPPAAVEAPRRRVRLLAVAWTVRAPGMRDHAVDPPAELRAEPFVELYAGADGAWHGPLRDPGGSRLGIPVSDPSDVRWAAKILRGAGGSARPILLASPVLDDVTLYHGLNAPEILLSGGAP